MPKNRIIYNPGELEKVREKLGPITDEEAIRMSKILGGEVGFEKLEETNLLQRETQIKPTSKQNERIKSSSKMNKAPTIELSSSFFDRWKINSLMAETYFSIKTQGQAFTASIRKTPEEREFVNAYFITTICTSVYKHIEQLVINLNLVLPKANKERMNSLKQYPLTNAIINTFLDYNLKALNQELSIMSKNPRSCSLSQLRLFIQNVYRPLIICLDCNSYAKSGVKILYTVAKQDSNPKEISAITIASENILREMNYLLSDVKFKLYPLLLRYTSKFYLPYEEFYLVNRKAILLFLSLTEKDIISLQTPIKTEQAETEKEIPSLEIEKEIQLEKQEETPKLSNALQHSLDVFESLFPDSSILLFPDLNDLYPYFSTIFKMPKGSEVINAKDPLLLVIILIQIIEELFFGFSCISFGTDITTKKIDLNAEIANAIDTWHSILDTLFVKNYGKLLFDLSQAVEISKDLLKTAHGQKLKADLEWLRKYYLFPHAKVESLNPTRPIKIKELKPLYVLVKEIKELLSEVVKDLAQNARGKQFSNEELVSLCTIKDPFKKFQFVIPNQVSKRIDSILRIKKQKSNNANLILYTYSFISLLDYLVNDKDCIFQSDNSGIPYRNENGIPSYFSNSAIDADLIFNRQLHKLEMRTKTQL